MVRDNSYSSAKHNHNSSGKTSEYTELPRYSKSTGYTPKYSGKTFSRHQNTEKEVSGGDVAVRRTSAHNGHNSYNSYNGYKKKGFGRYHFQAAAPAALPVRISFIGGLNEIGKNITMFEYGDEAIVVDCGMAFPDDTMLGVAKTAAPHFLQREES